MSESAPGPSKLPRHFPLRAGAATAVGVLLLAGLGLSWADAVTLGLVLVLLPILGVAQVRLLGDLEIQRLPVYVSSFVTLVVLGGLCAIMGWRRGGPGGLGFSAMSWSDFAMWTIGLTLAGLGILFVFRRALVALGLHEAEVVEALIPRTLEERFAFAALSVASGVATGVAGAAALTTVVFGVLHAYQGPQGMVRAGLLGGVLAWGLLVGGSLWPPIVAHALLDILAGIFLADRLVVRRDPGGVAAGA